MISVPGGLGNPGASSSRGDYLHILPAEQIKACAAAGKHVFCEKPIATDLAETIEAINACNSAGVK